MVKAVAVMGEVKIFENHESGLSPEVEYKSDTFETSPSKLTLVIRQLMGEVVVSD